MPHAAKRASEAIRLRLNGVEASTCAQTLDALLAEQGYAGQKVATAVNGTFIPERARAGQALADGDHVEVVSARQGG